MRIVLLQSITLGPASNATKYGTLQRGSSYEAVVKQRPDNHCMFDTYAVMPGGEHVLLRKADWTINPKDK